jgi:uncharacterized membrane protein YhdT
MQAHGGRYKDNMTRPPSFISRYALQPSNGHTQLQLPAWSNEACILTPLAQMQAHEGQYKHMTGPQSFNRRYALQPITGHPPLQLPAWINVACSLTLLSQMQAQIQAQMQAHGGRYKDNMIGTPSFISCFRSLLQRAVQRERKQQGAQGVPLAHSAPGQDELGT